MERILINKIKKLAASLTMTAVVFSSLMPALIPLTASATQANNGFATVTVIKYIDGQPANTTNSQNHNFGAYIYAYDDNTSSPGYQLAPLGSSNTVPYRISTQLSTSGINNYDVYEDYTSPNTSSSAGGCNFSNKPFNLVGYTTGDTIAEAEGGNPSPTYPHFSNLNTDKYVIIWNQTCSGNGGGGNGGGGSGNATPTARVYIDKFINGTHATNTNASAENASFQIQSVASSTSGQSTSNFSLSATPSGTSSPYQAMSAALSYGTDYSLNEMMTGPNAQSCPTGTSSTAVFTLGGYSSGSNYAAAVSGTMSSSSPNLTNIQGDKYVIIWNTKCANTGINATTTNNGGGGNGGGNGSSTSATSTFKVYISKFINGLQANASSSYNMPFNFLATYNSTSTGSGSGNYILNATSTTGTTTTPYQTVTAPITIGGSYATNEVMGGNTVATCPTTGTSTNATSSATTSKFMLAGYGWGDSMSQAMAMTSTTTSPSFSNLQSNKYVIIRNTDCANINGTVGTSTGVLAVTSIETVNGNGTADGTFNSGWKYNFFITVPTNETHIAMKFSDWMMNGGSSTMAVANNLRISTMQADNSNATVLITGANTYSTPTLHINGDLDPNTPGLQIKVLVETAIPVNSANGSYSTSYGVQSN